MNQTIVITQAGEAFTHPWVEDTVYGVRLGYVGHAEPVKIQDTASAAIHEWRPHLVANEPAQRLLIPWANVAGVART